MKVKGWHKFQHFKDRRPPWIKLYRDLLDDPDWHSLDASSAKALVMIWLIASESDGLLPDVRKLSFRLRMNEKQTKQVLIGLSHWLEQDDIRPISDGYQLDTPERETETYRKEAEGERASAPSKKPRIKKQEVPLPDDFVPSTDAVIAAGLSASEGDREFLKFKNHALQKARTCVNWQGAWGNWCLKAAEFLGREPGQKPPEAGPLSESDRAAMFEKIRASNAH